MLKRKVTVVALVAAVLGAIFLNASPAAATSGDGNCQSYEYCVWKDISFGLPMRDNLGNDSCYSGDT